MKRRPVLTLPSPAWTGWLAILGTFVLLAGSGCSTPSGGVRTLPGLHHAKAPAQMASIGRTAATPPVLVLSQLTAGGVREQRDDWTSAAHRHAKDSLQRLNPDRLIILDAGELSSDLAAELAEVQALFRTIDLNLAIYANPAVALPTVVGRFDFSVGGVDRLCDAAGADALLLIYGEDDYFTGDRKALAALGVVAGVLTGVAIQPSSGTEHLSAALIARDGTLLWFDVLGPGMIGDLRRPEGVHTTLQNLLRGLPRARGPLAPPSS